MFLSCKKERPQVIFDYYITLLTSEDGHQVKHSSSNMEEERKNKFRSFR